MYSSPSEKDTCPNGERENARLLEEAMDAAAWADTVVLCLGEHFRQTGESASRVEISLPEPQENLLAALRPLCGSPLRGSDLQTRLALTRSCAVSRSAETLSTNSTFSFAENSSSHATKPLSFSGDLSSTSFKKLSIKICVIS